MSQPEWECVGHIGDVDPIAHGGGFVYRDTTGVYAPCLAYFEPGSDEDWHKTEGATPLQVYRLGLDPPRFKTFMYGSHDQSKLADPSSRGTVWRWYNEWFVEDLPSVASSAGTTACKLLRLLFSNSPMDRASAYQDIIGHFGAYEFDQYPLTMTEDEAYAKYEAEMKLSLGRTV